jgi:hypothetical protein
MLPPSFLDWNQESAMKKYLAIGTVGLALALAHNPARAHDEVAYFVLGTIVGSAWTRHSTYYAPVVHPVPVTYLPAYHYAYYPPRPTVIVERRYYAPAPYYRYHAVGRHGHPHGGPPGQRRHGRGR